MLLIGSQEYRESRVKTCTAYWFENGCFQPDLREVSWAFDPVDNKVVEIWNVEELCGLLQVVTGALTEVNATPVQKLQDLQNIGEQSIIFHSIQVSSHLSKDPSDVKQKCTQLSTQFLGTVVNALSLGVIHFVRSVSLRNRFLVGWNSSTANQKTSISRFLKLTLRTKWITPCERAWKTVHENTVRNCVHFCLRPLEPLERCDTTPN